MTRFALTVAAIWLVTPALMLAQDKDETIRKLIERVEALEREVASLKQAAPAAPKAEVPASEEAHAQAALPATPSAAPASDGAAEPRPAESAAPDTSRFTLRGYADAGFFRNLDGDSTKRFAMGEVDLFATARISPKLSILMESVLETDNQLLNNDVPVNLERLLLQYRHNDYFNLDIGSYQTAIGYYSTAYLRASWFQTALSRPKLFTFEDDGGFLPLHNVGLSANGRIPSGDLGLHYIFEVGSSRNYGQAGRSGVDLEQNGAVNVAVYARPQRAPGLEVGFSSYHDKLTPAPGDFYDRAVWTAHAVYQAHRVEFLNEVLLAKFSGPDAAVNIPGFYSQFAYHASRGWTPYFRVDYANVYGTGGVVNNARHYITFHDLATGGLRYDISEAVALKFEVGREHDRFQPAWIRAAMQIAFTF